eukprot:gene21463-27498_t
MDDYYANGIFDRLIWNCPELRVLSVQRFSHSQRRMDARPDAEFNDVNLVTIGHMCKKMEELTINQQLILDDCWFSDGSFDVLSLGCKRLAYLSKLRTIGVVTDAAFVRFVEACTELTNIVSSPSQLSYTLQLGVHHNQDSLEEDD